MSHVLVVKNLAAFAQRYDTNTLLIAGEFSGSLDNGGEKVELVTAWGKILSEFTYDDGRGWPLSPDGTGHSLIPLSGVDQSNEELDYGLNWRASTYRDGSPGVVDPPPLNQVLINEIAAHTDNMDTNNFPLHDSDDWIELFNTAGTNINLGAWYLSDDPDDLKKWAIPNTNTINANGRISFDETTGFHNPITIGFGLNKSGEELFLSYLPGTDQDRVADSIRFKGQENDLSWGRYPDGERWLYTLDWTRDLANALAASAQRVVIDEFHYHPAPNEQHAEDNNEDEFIVLYNPNPTAIMLESPAGPWKIDGEVNYTFPSNTVLPAMSSLVVVSFAPTNLPALTNFLYTYSLTNGQLDLYGPWSGKLDNHVGSIALERPQLPDLVQQSVSWVIVDEVDYFDRNPWPIVADGNGASLHRIDHDVSGHAPTNWLTGSPTPASSLIGFAPVVNTSNGATNVGQTGATLSGELVSTGTAPATVTVYWGPNDAGKIDADWAWSTNPGLTAPGPINIPVNNLTENTVYFYRLYASNNIGQAWSFPSAWFKTLALRGYRMTG